MDSVEQVMKGLTNGERAFVSNGNLFRARTFYGRALVIARQLERAGLMERPSDSSQCGKTGRKPTPLGLEVRARLLSSGGEG